MLKSIPSHYYLCVFAVSLSITVPIYLLQSEEIIITPQGDNIVTKVPELKIASIDNLTRQPLFNAKRSANINESVSFDTTQDTQTAQTQTAPEAIETIPLILVGLVSGQNKAVAIVKDKAGDTINMRIGNINNGWRLVSINKSTAAFTNNGILQTISLNYANKAIGGPIISNIESDIQAENSEKETK